jgi:hypothetical protein
MGMFKKRSAVDVMPRSLHGSPRRIESSTRAHDQRRIGGPESSQNKERPMGTTEPRLRAYIAILPWRGLPLGDINGLS